MIKNTYETNNQVLRNIFIFSFAIHFLGLIYVGSLYKKSVLNYIDISIQNLSDEIKRQIPRPKIIPKPIEKPKNIQEKVLKPIFIPQERSIQSEKFDPGSFKDIAGQVAVPVGMEEASDSDIHHSNFQDAAYNSQKDYYDMIKLRIEANKIYPISAKEAQIEGRVIMSFILYKKGTIANLQIIKSSGNETLDIEAINAIKKSVPFPSAPDKLFQDEIPITITIIFELN